MKKNIFVTLLAVCALMFCSCSKNPAENFEGTYKVSSDVQYSDLSAKAGFDNHEEGTITITLVGDDGQVQVSGMFNTTGHVDRDGVLHLDTEEHVGADLGAGISFMGYSLVGVSFTTLLHHSAITLNEDGTMSWTANGSGAAAVEVLGIAVTVNANVTYTNVAHHVE